ncbi:MAG TPA: class I SAM-dependent methyltransferase [Phycisphaerae bacterium]|nr:class I SAM-dependent methyltransferase [Phycisphaerae bacterium]HNU44391.1 class I SAM-dependent methyltransferase [Phycisphaerae bacterium]
MQTQQQAEWLNDTRRFWDTDSDFEARFRRICSDPDIESCADPQRLEELWEKRTQEELNQLLSGIPLEAEWTCLEIGCGIGRLMRPLAKRCRRLIGVDISPKMVTAAKRYLRGVRNVELHVNDGQSLAMVSEASVDWVYSHLTFQHLTLPEVVDAYLAEIARVLRPGGYCRIQAWREAPLSWEQRLKNVARLVLGRERYHGPRRWLWAPGRSVKFGGITFHPRQWCRLLRSHGLRVESLELGRGHDYWMWSTSRKVV